jgi:hypothetical protein
MAENFAERGYFHVTFGFFTCRKARHGTDSFTSPPKEGVLRRPGLNPRTWVPKASTLPLDHRSRVRFYLPSPISVTVSISTVSDFIFLTLTPNIPILFTARSVDQWIVLRVTNNCDRYIKPINKLCCETHSSLLYSRTRKYWHFTNHRWVHPTCSLSSPA